MKKVLILALILIAAVIISGCTPTAPAIIDNTDDNIQIKMLTVEQLFYYGSKSIASVKDYKCPPVCPDCDSCCPDCPECEICEDCPTCPDPPECPDCPSYCVKWGDLLVEFQITNDGSKDYNLEEICIEITFKDGTKTTQCADTDLLILAGETIVEKVKYILDRPVKRVVFAELIDQIVK